MVHKHSIYFYLQGIKSNISMKSSLIFLGLLLFSISTNAQLLKDTTLFFDSSGEISDELIATKRTEIKSSSDLVFSLKYFEKNDKSVWKLNDNSKVITIENDSIQQEDSYHKNKLVSSKEILWKKKNSSLYYFKETKMNGLPNSEYYSRYVIPVIKDSVLIMYYPDINKKVMESYYQNNIPVTCTLYDRSGNILGENIKTVCDIPPKYDNKDLEYFREVVQKEMVYPPYAVENGIFGRVIVQFIVKSDGSLGAVNILRGVHKSLDDECIRAIKATKPRWSPGYDNGKPVNALLLMPLIFMLQ